MHRRGILIGGSRWQQNHWQSTQTAPPFDGGVCLRTVYQNYNIEMDNQYKIVDVGNGYKWAVSRNFREMRQLGTTNGYSTINRGYIGTANNQYLYGGYLLNLNSIVRQNTTKPNLFTIGLITYTATLLDDSIATEPKIAKFQKTGSNSDYTDFTTGITGGYSLFNTPRAGRDNLEITCIYNPDTIFHYDPNILTPNSNVKELLQYFGVLTLDTAKQQILFNTTLDDINANYWTNEYKTITESFFPTFGPNGGYVVPLFMPCWGCDTNVDGYVVSQITPNINKSFYVPTPQTGYPTQGMVRNTTGWHSVVYDHILTYNETDISFLNQTPTTQTTRMCIYWLDQLYKPIVCRMPFIDNNTAFQKRYIIYQFVLFNRTTGQPLGTVI